MFDVFSKKNFTFKNSSSKSIFYCQDSISINLEFLLDEYFVKGASTFSEINSEFVLVFFGGNSLYLTRSFFGCIPLYYFETNSEIFFSTNIKTLVEIDEYEKLFNEEKIIRYLSQDFFSQPYDNTTFWKNIYSVLPGNILEISEKGKKTSLFQNFENKTEPKKSVLDFKETFTQVLKDKVNFNLETVSSLSGGIDSSSITSMLQYLGLKSKKSLEFRTSNEINDEEIYVNSVVTKYNLEHTKIFLCEAIPETFEKETAVVKITGLPSNPYFSANFELGIYNFLNKNNVKQYLAGQGGDNVLYHAINYFDYLAIRKKWELLKTSVVKYTTLYQKEKDDFNSKKYIENIYFKNISILLKEISFGNFISKTFNLLKISFYFFKPNYLVRASNFFFKINSKPFYDLNSIIISKNEQNPTSNIYKFSFCEVNNELNEYINEIQNHQAIIVREQTFHLSRYFGVNTIYPFYDIRIAKFIHNTQKEVNFGEGYGRFVIRESLKGILPDLIRKRINKTEFSNHLFEIFKNLSYSIDFEKGLLIWKFIKKEEFRKMISDLNKFQEFRNFTNENFVFKDLLFVIKVLYLNIWLNEYCQKNILI